MDLISSFVLVISISLLLALTIIFVAKSIAPKSRTSGMAVDTYACGEPALLEGKVQFNLELFNYALYFMLFDILGFILFLSWGTPGFPVIVYLVITLVSVIYVSLSPQEV
jgi:NADH:ubiquinone oxidoreductase subunit 3 (subunit A)